MRAESVATPTPRRIGRAEAWARADDSVVRHLLGIAHDLELRVMHSLTGRGHAGLRRSFAPVLYLIWDEGRALGTMADELGISRQAMSHTAALVEAASYVERKPNPADRRSKLVMLTPRGRVLVEQGVQALLECRADYAAIVGPRSLQHLATGLAELREGLGLPAHPNPVLTTTARDFGALPLVALRAEADLMEATIARGHAAIRMSLLEVLALIGSHGARVNEMARVQGVSRQAISVTVQELEARGYLRRRPDRHDRRGVVFLLTERGTVLIDDYVAALGGLESRYRAILGDPRLEQLQQIARDLSDALHVQAATHETGSASRDASDAANAPAPRRSAHDLEQLAAQLRQRLGRADAGRLAELLAPPGAPGTPSRS
jgi:DNA-binding MarR family transcriptional regulator